MLGNIFTSSEDEDMGIFEDHYSAHHRKITKSMADSINIKFTILIYFSDNYKLNWWLPVETMKFWPNSVDAVFPKDIKMPQDN